MFATKDILLTPTGNGGDLDIQNDDIAMGELLYQQVYLCLCGGNIEADTRGDELSTEIRQDWWGNSLQFKNEKARQFNSLTERTLRNVVLNSSGRISIQRAVESDLQHFKSIAEIKVNVSILSTYRVQIGITLIPPQNQQGVSLQLVWDNAKKEMIIDRTI